MRRRRTLPSAIAILAAIGLAPTGVGYAQLGPVPGTSTAAPVSPGWLGVVLDSPDDGTIGARVVRIVPGGPAADSGLEVGWVVTAIDGASVSSVEEMIALVGSNAEGDTITLTLSDGSSHEVRLGGRPGSLEYVAEQYVGSALPGLSVHALDGSGLVDPWKAGTTTIVEFWATWCGPCRSAAPRVHALDTSYGDSVRVVAITDEDPADVGAWLDRNEAPGIVAIDPMGAAKETMWVMALPTWFVVDGEGIVRDVIRGADDIADLEAAVSSVAGPAPTAPGALGDPSE